MLYAMLAACATVILAFAVLVRLKPIAAWHASFGAGGIGRDDGPPRDAPSGAHAGKPLPLGMGGRPGTGPRGPVDQIPRHLSKERFAV